jgi:hypothetical protein
MLKCGDCFFWCSSDPGIVSVLCSGCNNEITCIANALPGDQFPSPGGCLLKLINTANAPCGCHVLCEGIPVEKRARVVYSCSMAYYKAYRENMVI